jgi:hypothetical protein
MPKIQFITITFIFCLTALNGQKLRLITKDSHAELFDYSNPYSLVSMLDANSEMIPSLVSTNQFSGVYHEQMLRDMGILPADLSSFTTWTNFQLARTEMGDTICLIRTEQSLDAYLDSISTDPDYEVLKTIEPKTMEKIWGHASNNELLKIPFDYYFDTEHISAFILEQRDEDIWVHFVSNISGKNFIGLSLKKSQLIDANNFVFFAELDSSNATKVEKYFHEQALSNIVTFGSQNETHGSNFCQFGEYSFGDNCRFDRMNYSFYYDMNYVSKNEGFLSNTQINTDLFKMIATVQSEGDKIEVMDWYTSDFSYLRKKQHTWKEFKDSLSEVEIDALFMIDSSILFQSFQHTEWNDFIRLPIKKNIYWVENEKYEVFILFNLIRDGKSPEIQIQQIYFTDNSGKERVSVMQFPGDCGFENSSLSIELSKIPEMINHSFLLLDEIKLKKGSFENMSKTVHLLNPTLNF